MHSERAGTSNHYVSRIWLPLNVPNGCRKTQCFFQKSIHSHVAQPNSRRLAKGPFLSEAESELAPCKAVNADELCCKTGESSSGHGAQPQSLVMSRSLALASRYEYSVLRLRVRLMIFRGLIIIIIISTPPTIR